MSNLKKKKLLLLGSNVGTLDIIRYAKNKGVHVIVTDNLTVEDSIGKQYADEHIFISTGDIEGLKRYIIEKEVDSVFCRHQ